MPVPLPGQSEPGRNGVPERWRRRCRWRVLLNARRAEGRAASASVGMSEGLGDVVSLVRELHPCRSCRQRRSASSPRWGKAAAELELSKGPNDFMPCSSSDHRELSAYFHCLCPAVCPCPCFGLLHHLGLPSIDSVPAPTPALFWFIFTHYTPSPSIEPFFALRGPSPQFIVAAMFRPHVFRQVARAATAQAPRAAFRPATPALASIRHFTCTPSRFDKDTNSDDPVDAATTAGEPGESGDHEGQYARTRDDIVVEYPEEKDLPPSNPVVGRGGEHSKRTLASFSMEGKVAVVTGGARGLGLVMAQALVTSGADVAIVDMNRDEGERSAKGLVDVFKKENPGSKRCFTPLRD